MIKEIYKDKQKYYGKHRCFPDTLVLRDMRVFKELKVICKSLGIPCDMDLKGDKDPTYQGLKIVMDQTISSEYELRGNTDDSRE